jgi:hypothetical protein
MGERDLMYVISMRVHSIVFLLYTGCLQGYLSINQLAWKQEHA